MPGNPAFCAPELCVRGDAMYVTYAGLIQSAMFVLGMVALFIEVYHNKK